MKAFENRGDVELKLPLRAHCCSAVLEAGTVVGILHHMSPKMVMLRVSNGYHKVKVSKLRTATGLSLEFLSAPDYADDVIRIDDLK